MNISKPKTAPLPASNASKGKPLFNAVVALEVGQCIEITDVPRYKLDSACWSASRSTLGRYTVRKLDDKGTFGIWRVS